MAGAFAALQRDADSALSNNEREFIVKALREGLRVDGRGPHELRPASFQFALDDSGCTVALGRTRVMAVVAATLEPPFADRHNEGSLRFNVEFSPMASPAFEPGRPGEDAIEVARLVERGLRESRAVDLEALVVLAGRQVWHLRVDMHVLDHGGNLAGACGLAALAALMAFRRPDVTVGGGDDGQAVTVHPPEVWEPVPLSIHHLPLPITFALFEDGELLAVDPSLKEEAAAAGRFIVTQNAFGELCSLQKIEGCGLTPPQLKAAIRLATQKVEELTGHIRKALQAHEVARVQARVRRQPGAAPAPAGGAGLGGRAVTVLRSDQLVPDLAAAAPAGGGGGAVALDLDALPDNLRSLLQKAAAQPDGAASMSEDEDEEGGSSSEEEGSSSVEAGDGSSSDEEEADGQEAAAAEADAALAAAVARQQAAAAATAQQQRGAAGKPPGKQKQKRRHGTPGSGSKEAQQDELAAIADMVAAAGGSRVDGGGDLSGAVKQKKRAKQGGGGGSGGQKSGKPARQR